MADFPDSVFEPRTTENIPGVVYDAAKTREVFAEDYSLPAEEIRAIEEWLLAFLSVVHTWTAENTFDETITAQQINFDGATLRSISGYEPGEESDGTLIISGGHAPGGDYNGGDLALVGGNGAGAGHDGDIYIHGRYINMADVLSGYRGRFDMSLLSADRIYQYPDAGGEVALKTGANGTFTTVDLKTVTVVDGIITSIV